MAALLAGRESIRDVIAFPKTATGQDPLTGAPAPIDERQLRELGIRVDAPPALSPAARSDRRSVPKVSRLACRWMGWSW